MRQHAIELRSTFHRRLRLEPLEIRSLLSVLGLDSKSTIDWSTDHSNNWQFGYCKVTEGAYWPTSGSSQQISFDNNVSACINANMAVGVYHFARPVDNLAWKEADTLASAFSSLRATYPNATWLEPMLDVEDSGPDDGNETPLATLGASGLATWIEAWMSEFQADLPGVYPIVYLNRSYAAALAPYLSGSYSLWIAVAGGTQQYGTPPNPPPSVQAGVQVCGHGQSNSTIRPAAATRRDRVAIGTR